MSPFIFQASSHLTAAYLPRSAKADLDDAIENLERYLKTYPADKNVIYAHYLIAIIYFEQIEDEKKDLKPLIDANNKIDFF